MTIQEILEAHLFVPGGFVDPGNHCSCGNYYNNEYFAGSIQLDEHLKHVAEVLDKHMQEREAQLRQLVRDMTDPGACWFDHRGGCQEHGYLDLEPGELCPHAEAKRLLGDDTDGR